MSYVNMYQRFACWSFAADGENTVGGQGYEALVSLIVDAENDGTTWPHYRLWDSKDEVNLLDPAWPFIFASVEAEIEILGDPRPNWVLAGQRGQYLFEVDTTTELLRCIDMSGGNPETPTAAEIRRRQEADSYAWADAQV